MKTVSVLERTSFTGKLNASLRRLQKTSVYVGIAKGSKGDRRTDGGPDNHLLGYVHEKGSPAVNIPARPFLVPGVSAAKSDLASTLGAALKAALHDDDAEVQTLVAQAGFQAVSSVKSYMQTAEFEPLKESTMRNRNRSRLTKGKRDEEKRIDRSSIRPLINTGELRDAIDFYVEEG